MTSRQALLAGSFLILMCLAAPASAQPAPSALDEFGTQDGIDLWIPATQFTAVGLGVPPGSWMCCVEGFHDGYYFSSSDTGIGFEALIALPQGALLDSWRAFYYDNSASGDFHIELDKYYDDITASPTRLRAVYLPTFDSSGTPGFANHHQTFGGTIDLREPYPGSDVTRSQAADFYVFLVKMPADQNVAFKGVRVFWHRQVSPAPATATFNDVPTSDPAFQYIEALAASGITSGCNTSPPMYCPDATLTRRQMAVFLSKALGLHWPPF